MPEEGAEGAEGTKGGNGGKNCPTQIHFFTVVTSLFAATCVFLVWRNTHKHCYYSTRKKQNVSFLSSVFANFRILQLTYAPRCPSRKVCPLLPYSISGIAASLPPPSLSLSLFNFFFLSFIGSSQQNTISRLFKVWWCFQTFASLWKDTVSSKSYPYHYINKMTQT